MVGPSGLIIIFLAASYIWSLFSWHRRTRGLPLPPGPKPLPIIGNICDVPVFKMWEGFRDLTDKYGSITHLRVLGQSIFVLGSQDVIFEFLQKRSSNTSSRSQTPLFDLIGQASNFVMMPYGPRWRNHRRTFQHHFSRTTISEYEPIQLAATHKLLMKLLMTPSEAREHIRHLFVNIVLRIAYSMDVTDESDGYVRLLEESLATATTLLVPGKFAVDILPFLRYMPAWFPGSGKQRVFTECKTHFRTLEDTAYAHVKDTIEAQGASPSIVGQLISGLAELDKLERPEAEALARNIGNIAFLAGSDTTYSTLQAALVGLSLYPNVLKRAQAELDSVVGGDRLPLFSDLGLLEYVSAIVKEATRWHQSFPIAFPHCTVEDDEIHGYFVPAGTVLIANVWTCMHDPEIYENPDDFRPERFLKENKATDSDTIRDPFDFVFGFGRRICPGRDFAVATLTIALASLLHVFNVDPPVDGEGNPISVERGMTDGVLSYPVDCRYTITPRSAEAEALIRGLE